MSRVYNMTDRNKLSHSDLIDRALRWLVGTGGCHIAAAEVDAGREIVDAIGWNTRRSIQIECKTSKADFRRGRKEKFSRIMEDTGHKDYGVGNYRYYMAPAGVIPLDEVPFRWGLLEVRGDRVWRKKSAGLGWTGEGLEDRERAMLVKIVTRKFGYKCVCDRTPL